MEASLKTVAANGRGADQAPVRVQLSRRSGFRLPPNTVVVSRPSCWGNPFSVPKEITGAARLVAIIEAVGKYRAWVLAGGISRQKIRKELRGKNLACWCEFETPDGKPVPCHADVLLKLANS